MKIIKFEAENFKKLKAVNIEPSSNVVMLSGSNGSGKSSILDAIELAIGGVGSVKKPIRDGEKKAKIRLGFGEFTVSRNITEKSSVLKIESVDGYEQKSPQKFLDSLMGRISFDPMLFINSKPKEQRQILLDFTGLDIDRFDKDRKEIYDNRTILRRSYKENKNVLQSKVLVKDMPQDEIKINDLMLDLDKKKKHNLEIDDFKKELEINKKELTIINNEVKELEIQLSTLKEKEDGLEHKIKTDTSSFSYMIKEDEESILKEIGEVDKKNAIIRENAKYKELKNTINLMLKDGEKMTKDIEDIDLQKDIAIRESNMPIENLSFSDNGVLINNIPLEELSSAEKIKTGVSISMALNPKIKVLRITDGSLLDSNSLKIISEMAEKQDYQVWIEKVDTTGKVGFYIEDGSVVDERI